MRIYPCCIFVGLQLLALALVSALTVAAPQASGVAVHYQLPATGPLPITYRVTLAITDAHNPNWIISEFAAGVVRTVTEQNQGRFIETWDGLDDNYMPVPPGEYGVKGIYMPAEKWEVDGEYHSVTPRFLGGASSWNPTPQQWNKPEPFGGDPVGSPLDDVDVGLNGHAVFYWQYLENGRNNPVMDLNKPEGYDQVLQAYPSGGAAGGSCTCTDGDTVWSFSEDGGPKYVYRADGKPFGTDSGQRPNVYRPAGWVHAMACWRDQSAAKTYVYIAEGGHIDQTNKWPFYIESSTNFVDTISIHDGDDGKLLGSIPVTHPIGMVARFGRITVLHQAADGRFEVAGAPLLSGGLPAGELKLIFAIPASIHPADFEMDSHGRFYVSDSAANKVYRLNADGSIAATIGRLDCQQPGTYDPLTLMAPDKLATWTDTAGDDRLLVVEDAGPNRVSEWSPDGKLIREFQTLQTKANDGYAVDPDHPDEIYIGGQRHWLQRYHVDYATGAWKVDAVWPEIGIDPVSPGFDHPRFIRLNDHEYLACTRSRNIYRLDGDKWALSSAIITTDDALGKRQYFTWHDANGDGKVEPSELTPLEMPGVLLRYHGENFLADLSDITLNQTGPDVWRLPVTGFDKFANPVFGQWTKVLTDPVFADKEAGAADATHGGNELATRYSSDWAEAEGIPGGDIYVTARGGHDFSANQGAQQKLSRYVPDGKGGYTLKWRAGRAVLEGNAEPGQVYGAIHLNNPIDGIVPVIDQSRCGIVLYTTDGLYVDTLFLDGRVYRPDTYGVYPLPGEFFAGSVYPNQVNGKIYAAMGKYTPMLYQISGWSTTYNPVHALTTVQRTVTIDSSEIASAPDVALFVRGGPGAAHLAQFDPAVGGANLTGTMTGWEGCRPVDFASDKDQTVEARCLYDPDHIYLRWHARLPGIIEVKALPQPERIFTHDRLADTMSFYIQGNADAKPSPGRDGRPGDVRFVVGLYKDATGTVKPMALGMYPTWDGPGKGNPVTYSTPTGKVTFANVAPVSGAVINSVIDPDNKGFVIAASIPRSAIPGLPHLGGSVRTLVDFEATFGGHNKFWWADSDGSASRETYDEPTEARLYPGAWAPARFTPLDNGLVVRQWLVCGPFGGQPAAQWSWNPGGNTKNEVRQFYEAAHYPPDNGIVDLTAIYTGDITSGYWNKTAARWRPATIADLDTRVIAGTAAQVDYGVSWIHVPVDTSLDFEFQGHPQTALRFYLNSAEVLRDYAFDTITKTLVLKAGWNQIEWRGYCVGYSPFRAGLILKGDESKLWTVSLSATPPGP